MSSDTLSPAVLVWIPGIAMLELASTIVHDLNQHLMRKQQEFETQGEEEDAHECLELRFDLSITQRGIDPQRWAEDKAAHGEFSRGALHIVVRSDAGRLFHRTTDYCRGPWTHPGTLDRSLQFVQRSEVALCHRRRNCAPQR